jgi:starch synthase
MTRAADTRRRRSTPAAPAVSPPAPTASGPYPLVTQPGNEPVTVVHLSAELAPFARTGGLGEAVSSLAHYQARTGMKVAIIMPLYRQVLDVATDLEPVGEPFTVQVGPRAEEARLFESLALKDNPGKSKPRILFIQNAQYFGREHIYGDSRGDYPDNDRRFAFFSLAALGALPRIVDAPILLHAHDWHAALAPIYLRTYESDPDRELFRRTSSVLSVHNAGFQGHFPPEALPELGLPWELFNFSQLE